jgi:hypothetical protein
MCLRSHPPILQAGGTLVPERVYPGISATSLGVRSSAILASDGRYRHGCASARGAAVRAGAAAVGQRRRSAPPRARSVPAQPPRARPAGAGRAPLVQAAPHSRSPPRGGRAARGRGRDLVHVARAGPRHQPVVAGAGRDLAHVAVRRERALAPVHARRLDANDGREPVPRPLPYGAATPGPAGAVPGVRAQRPSRPARL